MSASNRIMNDLSQIANGAFSTLGSAKSEVEGMMKQRLERAISDLDVVTRDEFEIVRDMAVEARKENDALRAELDAIKQKLND